MTMDQAKVLANARSLRERVESMWVDVGEYSAKSEARLKGCSVHVKYSNEVDINTSVEFHSLMLNAPELIVSLCAHLEEALGASVDG